MGEEKQVVKEFYDTFGWHRNANGVYEDTASFVDMRSVVGPYHHKTHMRVKGFLPSRGDYFLDAGSGAIPHPEYLEYSYGHKLRVCVDLSRKGLMEAKAKLRGRSIEGDCVLADVSTLPFRDSAFDATISAHVLYHVPQNEQQSAVLELYRTLKPGRSCVIIYGWRSMIEKLAVFVVGILARIPVTHSFLRRIVKRTEKIPPLYFHTHDYRWFLETFPDDWDLEIRCWRSVDNLFTQVFVPNNLLGHLMMETIYWLEMAFPHTLARIGNYAMIIVRRNDRSIKRSA